MSWLFALVSTILILIGKTLNQRQCIWVILNEYREFMPLADS